MKKEGKKRSGVMGRQKTKKGRNGQEGRTRKGKKKERNGGRGREDASIKAETFFPFHLLKDYFLEHASESK